MENDSEIIANYTKPAYVLGEWTPTMAPLILIQPESAMAKKGEEASFNVEAASIPEPNYQWFKNGKVITGATNEVLHFKNVNASEEGNYSVIIKNRLGSVKSYDATLVVMYTK
jgi:hypothetical protein